MTLMRADYVLCGVSELLPLDGSILDRRLHANSLHILKGATSLQNLYSPPSHSPTVETSFKLITTLSQSCSTQLLPLLSFQWLFSAPPRSTCKCSPSMRNTNLVLPKPPVTPITAARTTSALATPLFLE
jgi:hypothetical protein